MTTERLSVKAVALELKVSYITALSYIRDGHISGIWMSTHWEVPLEEIVRYKQEGSRLPYQTRKRENKDENTSNQND